MVGKTQVLSNSSSHQGASFSFTSENWSSPHNSKVTRQRERERIAVWQLLVELEQNITAQSTYSTSTSKWLSAKMHNVVSQTINAQSSYRTNGLWLIAWPQGPTYCANQTVTNCVSGLPLEFRLLMHYRLIAWLLMTECVRDLQLFFPVWLSAI